MRRVVAAGVVVAVVAGCAGTKGAKPPAGAQAHATPVVSEPAKLSERLRVNRQREAERETLNDTEILGDVVR